jgi:hypothetical protein
MSSYEATQLAVEWVGGLFDQRFERTEPCSCLLITVKRPGYRAALFNQLSILIDDMLSDIFITTLQIIVRGGQIVGWRGKVGSSTMTTHLPTALRLSPYF